MGGKSLQMSRSLSSALCREVSGNGKKWKGALGWLIVPWGLVSATELEGWWMSRNPAGSLSYICPEVLTPHCPGGWTLTSSSQGLQHIFYVSPWALLSVPLFHKVTHRCPIPSPLKSPVMLISNSATESESPGWPWKSACSIRDPVLQSLQQTMRSLGTRPGFLVIFNTWLSAWHKAIAP